MATAPPWPPPHTQVSPSVQLVVQSLTTGDPNAAPPCSVKNEGGLRPSSDRFKNNNSCQLSDLSRRESHKEEDLNNINNKNDNCAPPQCVNVTQVPATEWDQEFDDKNMCGIHSPRARSPSSLSPSPSPFPPPTPSCTSSSLTNQVAATSEDDHPTCTCMSSLSSTNQVPATASKDNHPTHMSSSSSTNQMTAASEDDCRTCTSSSSTNRVAAASEDNRPTCTTSSSSSSSSTNQVPTAASEDNRPTCTASSSSSSSTNQWESPALVCV